jgi:hypothetical protein
MSTTKSTDSLTCSAKVFSGSSVFSGSLLIYLTFCPVVLGGITYPQLLSLATTIARKKYGSFLLIVHSLHATSDKSHEGA